MRSSPRRIALALACLAIPTVLTGRALADTYTTYAVSVNNSGNVQNVGLTDDGSLTLKNATDLSYTVFTPPSSFVTSTTAPSLAYDNGTACTPSVTGYTAVSQGRCNGDREIFQAARGTSGSGLFLYQVGLPVELLYTGAVGNLLLNSAGDIAFVGIGGRGDTNYLLYDTTSHISPEPSSLALLGTGMVGLAGALRRRLRRA